MPNASSMDTEIAYSLSTSRSAARVRSPASTRLVAVDAVRGLVIVLMVLDHTRDFFSTGPAPTDLSRTHAALFFTRWITHLCAPAFIFLAGTSAYFVGQRCSRAELQRYLLLRGAWLVLLEFTLVNFMWQFNLGYSMGLVMQVIWAIGASMCALSLLLLLPRPVLLGVSLLGIAGHNLLDAVRPETFGAWAPLWKILHVQGALPLGFVLYPLVPWVFVMALGYCAGGLYQLEQAERRRILVGLGLAACALFVLLRLGNGYGDPKAWSTQAGPVLTLLSFLNVSKYPPSLDYLLVMLGITFLFLAWFEARPRASLSGLVAFGRVPLFAYVVHLGLVHLLAGLFALVMGFGTTVLTHVFLAAPRGWDLGLAGVYCAWLLVLCLLYPACRAFAAYKRRNREAWLSYC